MNKRCARCEKTVYPLEELKCLDKIWHKGCFKCQECAMTLSMKTYKGYNKLPYCEAHIPKAKATTVAETPEMRRLAENTKIQSNVQYHADFEKNKAKFTQVADDPETQRLKKNTQIISNVAYHGELAKKEEMERKRLEPGDNDEERHPCHRAHGEDLVPANASVHPTKLPHLQRESHGFGYDSRKVIRSDSSMHSHPPPPSFTHSHQVSQAQSPPAKHRRQYTPPVQEPLNSVTHYVPETQGYFSRDLNHHPPYSRFNENPNPPPDYDTPSGLQIHNANTHYAPEYIEQSSHYPPNPAGGQNALNNRYSGKPTNGSSGSYYSTNKHGAASSQSNYPINSHYAIQQPNRRVGSIADYDPVNEQYGSISQPNAGGGGYRQETTYQIQRSNLYGDQVPAQQHVPPPQMNSNATHHKVNAPPTQLGRCYRAMYDYEAADTDEVSFKDGDLIINCTAIDEGWMTGTIQRTGITGMLPANYVERVS